jgi:hypothetical protein
MFTIGIFTTHVPYIAFVAFYAFFVLFGVGKASSGDFTSDDIQGFKIYQSQPFTVNDLEGTNSSTCDFAAPEIYSTGSNEAFILHAKFLHWKYQSANFSQLLNYTTLFCRPPPAII